MKTQYEKAIDQIMANLETLPGLSWDETEDLKAIQKTLNVIKVVKEPGLLPVLNEVLHDKVSYILMESAAEAMTAIGTRSVPYFTTALCSTKYRYVRYLAATALGRLGDRRAIPLLRARLETETDSDVNDAICNAIAQL